MKEIMINSSKILLKGIIRIITQSNNLIIFNYLPKTENNKVTGSFEYIFKNITQDMDLICKFSDILCVNLKQIEERDLYLKKLGRAQYDPQKPLYVPLFAFIIIEEEFLKKFCKTSADDLYKFVKTM